MKNSIIRRSLSGVLAVAMVFSAYSCGKNDKGNESKPVQTANEVVKNSYTSMDIDIEIPASYIDSMFYIKDTAQVLIMGSEDENQNLYITDMDFSGFNKMPLNFPKTKNSQSYLRTSVSPEGYIYALFTLIDYGDVTLPNYNDPNFDYDNFDFDALNEAAKYSYTLYKLSSDGQVLLESPLENIESFAGESSYDAVYIGNIVAGAEGNLVISLSGQDEVYLNMTEDGKITSKIAKDDMEWVNLLATDIDGNIICSGYSKKGECIKYIDINSKTFKDSGISSDELSKMNGISSIYTGSGDYKMFISNMNGLFGVDKDNNIEEVINWLDSDINGDTVYNIIALDDGDFIAYINNYQNDTSGFVRLTKRNPEELAKQKVITLAMLYNDSSITSKITDFNKTNSDYRIKISDYSKYNEWDDKTETMKNSAAKQLKMDIISGNTPDMIITYDFSMISELAPKGTFTNLYTFLENDPDLSKDDIMPNVLKASEIKGKLYSMSPSFNVDTLACKSKFFDTENWTLDDLIDVMHQNKGMKLLPYSSTKQVVFETLSSSIDSCIDYNKAECDFNSGEFKKLIEFCNEFPDEEEEINWETATEAEMEAYWNERETLCMEDKALLNGVGFYDLTQYKVAEKVIFNDDITLVGKPSADGKGANLSFNNAMAILESSPNKDVCWTFMKEFFTEEYQTNRDNMFALPSLVKAFDKKAEDSMKKPYWVDDEGKEHEYDNTYFVNGKDITIDPLTKEEKDFVVKYIKSADKVPNSYYGNDIGDIINNEVSKYFKKECTSQQACDTIQNRVSILLSEQS